jgi:ankyrin repeat protein
MRFRHTLLAIILSITTLSALRAETKVGGMTAQQAFPDIVTAQWVHAVDKSDFREADRQLAQGAKVNLIGTDGITPMLWMMGAHRWVTQRLEYMLKAGADPNLPSPKNQASPMYIAAGGDISANLALMLKYHGDPNLMGCSDDPILFVAVENARMDNINLLLSAGADINRLDRNGESAANQALIRGRFDIIAYFLDHGLTAGLNMLARESQGTPLPPGDEMQAWKEKVINMLKARGADFTPKPHHRRKPIIHNYNVN